jgi:hypothetical protein
VRRVVIESPFAGKTPAETARNVRYARAAIRDCLLRGEAPYASHSIYTLEGVLDDTVPEERSMGMAAGWAWVRSADLVAVYIDLGISPGMQAGIARAKELGREIVERRLEGAWADGTGPVCLHVQGARCKACGLALSPLGAALAASKARP